MVPFSLVWSPVMCSCLKHRLSLDFFLGECSVSFNSWNVYFYNVPKKWPAPYSGLLSKSHLYFFVCVYQKRKIANKLHLTLEVRPWTDLHCSKIRLLAIQGCSKRFLPPPLGAIWRGSVSKLRYELAPTPFPMWLSSVRAWPRGCLAWAVQAQRALVCWIPGTQARLGCFFVPVGSCVPRRPDASISLCSSVLTLPEKNLSLPM